MSQSTKNQSVSNKETSQTTENQAFSEAEKIILASANKVDEKPTKKVTKQFATLYGLRFGAKPNSNLRLAVKLFESKKGKENITWQELFEDYKKILLKNDLKIDKNTKGRLRRILSRTIVSGISRESIQGLKFNLYANYTGIKIVTTNKFTYNSDFNVSPSEVYNNLYSFKFASKVNRKMKADITPTLKKQIEAFKNPNKVAK